jgi:hypothetical protein
MIKKTMILFLFCFMVGAIMTVPAYAATFTFQPNPTDMQDLPHTSYYLWNIDWSLPSGQSITGATLQFSDIYNTENNPSDRLYIHLLNNPYPSFSGGWSTISSNLKSGNDADNGTDQFGGYGLKIAEAIIGSTHIPSLSYNFDLPQIATLTNYAADGHFGFGIDPDCQYPNSGITFTITTCPASVPEPASMFLLGSGLIGLAGFARKRFRRN